MPRRKIQMALIDKAGSRTRSFKGRKEGLKKKARELSVLCGVDVAVVCARPGGGGGAPAVWEFGSAGVIGRYRRLPADRRAKHTHLSYLNAELRKEKDKLAKEWQEGPKQLAPPGAASLKGVNLEELLGSIDAALLATARRRKALGVPDDGVAAVGSDDDMEAWIDELTWHGVELNNPLETSMAMQPAASGVQYINNDGSQGDMGGGNQYLQQMGGNGDENGHGQLAWDTCQLRNTVSCSCPDYGFQYDTGSNCSYSDMAGGCPQMPVPSSAIAYDGCWFDQALMWGADESPRDAVVPAEYYHPSLDITCNPAYMPPAEHSGVGVPAIGLDGGFMDASGHGYGTQCLADYFECPDGAQQYGDEPLHYLSDVADGGVRSCSNSLVQSSPSQMRQMIPESRNLGWWKDSTEQSGVAFDVPQAAS
ncbi:hypothetical protein PVAP13_5KG345600 [Panicum virgatum]|uniref:MADS-box domain-containing protein n=1 Tax=Panicum virgatum TaxID=38727 RepID=A0A8T0SN92_PANVG|nr:hypothetical protein PVAP13_5KG345600 [Panicum virgatum]